MGIAANGGHHRQTADDTKCPLFRVHTTGPRFGVWFGSMSGWGDPDGRAVGRIPLVAVSLGYQKRRSGRDRLGSERPSSTELSKFDGLSKPAGLVFEAIPRDLLKFYGNAC